MPLLIRCDDATIATEFRDAIDLAANISEGHVVDAYKKADGAYWCVNKSDAIENAGLYTSAVTSAIETLQTTHAATTTELDVTWDEVFEQGWYGEVVP